MPGGGANRITGKGICPEGEPITSQGKIRLLVLVKGGVERVRYCRGSKMRATKLFTHLSRKKWENVGNRTRH
eukprot:2122642-Pyramimonas_sp.AAC.1